MLPLRRYPPPVDCLRRPHPRGVGGADQGGGPSTQRQQSHWWVVLAKFEVQLVLGQTFARRVIALLRRGRERPVGPDGDWYTSRQLP